MKQLSAAIVLALCAMGAAHADTLYDATADFQTQTNGAGVWSAGYSHGDASNYSMTLFDVASNSGWNEGWTKAGYVTYGTPAFFKNTTTGSANGVGAGQIALHPGPLGNADFAILRFTAPTSGTYQLSGQFFAGDIGSMSGSIVRDGDLQHPLQFFSSTNDQSVFAPTSLTLTGGETLDFVVGNNGSFWYGSTPLAVNINAVTAVPEPESYAMLLAGVGLLGLIARRRRPQ